MIETLWRMSIYGSVLIVPVLAARLFLQKYPTEYSYVLCMPVLVRLLVPVFIVGSMSLQPDLQVFLAEGQMAIEKMDRISVWQENGSCIQWSF